MALKVITIFILIQIVFGSEHCKRNYGGLKPNPKELDGKHYAGVGEYPWSVALMKDDKIICAGSLIQPTVVLTSAHCTYE